VTLILVAKVTWPVFFRVRKCKRVVSYNVTIVTSAWINILELGILIIITTDVDGNNVLCQEMFSSNDIN